MLILSRRPGEALFLTDGARRFKVAVLGLKGNQIKLGIDAPPDVRVDREETLWRKGAQDVRSLPTATRKTLGLPDKATEESVPSDDEILALLL